MRDCTLSNVTDGVAAPGAAEAFLRSQAVASQHVQSAAVSVAPYRFSMTACGGRTACSRRSSWAGKGSPLETSSLREGGAAAEGNN